MAPHSSYKKHVKFAKCRSPVPRKKIPSSAESYANIVLHYLSKLRGVFQAPPSHVKDGKNYYRRDAYDPSSKSILKKVSRRFRYASDTNFEAKQKAAEIVNAALQYGCANNIIEKMGNYFLVKHNTSTKRPTPGPDYIRCASCKTLTKVPRKQRSVVRIKGKKGSRTYYDGDYGRTTPTRRKRSTSNTSTINYCTKCYSNIKSNRRL